MLSTEHFKNSDKKYRSFKIYMRSLGLLYLSVGHAFTEDKEGIAFPEKIFFVQFFGPELDVGHLLAARHLLGRHEDLAAIRTRRILYKKN
jgi:hypothetical protein